MHWVRDEGHRLQGLVRKFRLFQHRIETNAFIHSGNVLGFRVIRPCGPCSVSRASPMDGFIWHYRSAAITTRPRLYDVFPSPSLPLSSPDSSDSEHESSLPRPSSRPVAALPTSRTKEPPAQGSKLQWANVPHPQADFEDGLVAEPADWIRAEGDDTWWLENGIAKHCRARRSLRRETTESRDWRQPCVFLSFLQPTDC